MGLYVLFWGAVAAYFSFADRHRDLLESNLSSIFDRDVSIEKVITSWDGFTPQFQINNLVIAGSTPDQAAFSFTTLSAELNPISVLRFWPKFKQFAVASPQLEVVSLDDGSLQIAGLKMGKGIGGSSDKLINWLLDQHSAVWHKGALVWRRQDKQVQRYEDISFVYQREQNDRRFNAAIETTKGIIALKAQADGDLFSQRDWGANIQVLGSGGRRLLSADDLSAEVIDGQGEFSLTTLSIARIQDFLQFAGLTPDQHWLLAAEVSGRLHDLKFSFSGPLLKINDWSIQGSASDIAFKSPGDEPSMSNLSGEIRFGRKDGSFSFETKNSELSWPAQFHHSFPIVHAAGKLEWQRQDTGHWDVYLKNASFEDPVINIDDLDAHAQIIDKSRRDENFADLFKVNDGLDSDDDVLVVAPKNSPSVLKAQARFEVTDLSGMVRYLPKVKSLNLFRQWSEEAFQSGVATNGSISYDGELSLSAIIQGRARLNMIADFDDTLVDYSPQFRWPAVTDAKGQLRLDNQTLSVLPSEARMNGDPMTDSEIIIERLFELDRTLLVNSKTTTSLYKGLNFLFKGPLIKPENHLETLPFDAQGGALDIDLSVKIPLSKLQNITVKGNGVIRDGHGVLASGVSLEDLEGKILFTERTAKSDNLRASFLGGEVQATLTTVKPAQPPVVRLDAQGIATARGLEPWLGEHLLTLFSGQTSWQGSILLDGNNIEIDSSSELQGLAIDVPAPIGKTAEQSARLDIDLDIDVEHFSLDLDYRDILNARLQTAPKQILNDGTSKAVSIFDRTMITLRQPDLYIQQTGNLPGDISSISDNPLALSLKEGVNFDLQYDNLNIDDWLSTIIDLAAYEPKEPSNNSVFLDSMRSINLRVQESGFLACSFGSVNMNLLSVDGKTWIGKFNGDHIDGTARLEPRAGAGRYDFNLSRLNIPDGDEETQDPAPIDHALDPSRYPIVNLVVDQFDLAEKQLGQLVFKAAPDNQSWKINTLTLTKDGLVTSGDGVWTNTADQGSISRVKFETIIDEAGGALEDIDFKGILRKGKGNIVAKLNWIGAPHELAYSRLNGDFDIFVEDGELVQVASGGGKILGLLNMNAILRRLAFDFSDVVAAGLRFDRMKFVGVLADGEAVIQDAFLLSPAVFVTMEGNVNIDKELIDMEIHVSPELGGNIALLSALANPAAGAVVFLTQQLFKDDLRSNSFRSFRALGTWDDFELEEISKRDSKIKSKNEEPETPEEKAIKDQSPVGDVREPVSTQE